MHTPLLTKNFDAEGAIARYRLVAAGTSDGKIVQAASATAAIIGVSTDVGAADKERCDAHLAGASFVEYGGAVSFGDFLTADSEGKAITSAPAAGVNHSVAGRALEDGIAGTIGSVLITPSQIQG